MILDFQENDTTLRCLFSGELNSDQCAQLEADLARRIAASILANAQRKIVFDMAQTTYISSAFLRICLFYCKKVTAERFAIENTSSDLKKVFEITGFFDMMKIS